MFGGSLIQAPNPIDFDKVFVEFTRLSETGNVAVLATIVCVFMLYFATIVFARRADMKDEKGVSRSVSAMKCKSIHSFYSSIFQQIRAMPIYGQKAIIIRHPCITDILR